MRCFVVRFHRFKIDVVEDDQLRVVQVSGIARSPIAKSNLFAVEQASNMFFRTRQRPAISRALAACAPIRRPRNATRQGPAPARCRSRQSRPRRSDWPESGCDFRPPPEPRLWLPMDLPSAARSTVAAVGARRVNCQIHRKLLTGEDNGTASQCLSQNLRTMPPSQSNGVDRNAQFAAPAMPHGSARLHFHCRR